MQLPGRTFVIHPALAPVKAHAWKSYLCVSLSTQVCVVLRVFSGFFSTASVKLWAFKPFVPRNIWLSPSPAEPRLWGEHHKTKIATPATNITALANPKSTWLGDEPGQPVFLSFLRSVSVPSVNSVVYRTHARLDLNTTIITTPHRHSWLFIRSVTGFLESTTKNAILS